ncbi:MAG: DNA-binding response regulator, partial [Phycisphaeraceae bacterium]|nr:DNA-binding response regulator [Phycisphaeraceae bacterium]
MAHQPQPAEAVRSATGAPPHVLVVDDEPPIREILKFQLENAGYTVSCAE